MNDQRTSSSHEPAAQRSAGRPTQPAGGLSAGRRDAGVIRSGERDSGLVNRSRREGTPRRYEQPIEDD